MYMYMYVHVPHVVHVFQSNWLAITFISTSTHSRIKYCLIRTHTYIHTHIQTYFGEPFKIVFTCVCVCLLLVWITSIRDCGSDLYVGMRVVEMF